VVQLNAVSPRRRRERLVRPASHAWAPTAHVEGERRTHRPHEERESHYGATMYAPRHVLDGLGHAWDGQGANRHLYAQHAPPSRHRHQPAATGTHTVACT
jgi:hypothetical protein